MVTFADIAEALRIREEDVPKLIERGHLEAEGEWVTLEEFGRYALDIKRRIEVRQHDRQLSPLDRVKEFLTRVGCTPEEFMERWQDGRIVHTPANTYTAAYAMAIADTLTAPLE